MVSEKPITAQQAAEFLIVSPRTIYRLIDSGQLAGQKIGNSTAQPMRPVLRIYTPGAILLQRARVNIKESFYVNHPQGRRLALSFRYAVREKN